MVATVDGYKLEGMVNGRKKSTGDKNYSAGKPLLIHLELAFASVIQGRI